MLSASYLTFRRANLSLMGCTSAEPISVSVRSKVQRIKLYLQTVEIPNHFHLYLMWMRSSLSTPVDFSVCGSWLKGVSTTS
jgi:hypothetical protein